METRQADKLSESIKSRADAPSASTFGSVFDSMIQPALLESLCGAHAPVPRTPPRLTAAQVVTGLIYHQLQASGTLAQNAFGLHQIGMSDAAFSQRRQGLPQELFDEIAAAALGPLADEQKHPDAFYKGLRLVGMDGTQCSVCNTPRLLAALPKAASRRLKAAFAKLQIVTLIELGLHNPLAAAVAGSGTGETTLAQKIWKHVPDGSLLIIDRGFGTTLTLDTAQRAWEDKRVEWLARIRKDIKTEIIERLPDGSALVEAENYQRNHKGKRIKSGKMRMREIRYEVVGRDGKRSTVRLWTSLLDAENYPALELAQNYAKRWEHEVAYRELKLDVRSTPLLASYTMETAQQEVIAVVLAMAVVTRVRVAAGETLGVPTLRVSFLKVLHLTQQLWETFAWSDGARSSQLTAQLCQQYFEALRRRAILPARRARSCPRAVRQPVSSWPRKHIK
jgi:Transposase DDE domain